MTKMHSEAAMLNAGKLFGRRKRCSPIRLFGRPDPLELEKAYEEAVMESQKNFAKRWDLDLLTMEPSEPPAGGHLLWEVEVRERLAVHLDTAAPPRDAEVGRKSSPAVTKRADPLRYSPYQKQQKLTDTWRITKSSRQTTQNKQQIKTSEDGHPFSSSFNEISNTSLQ